MHLRLDPGVHRLRSRASTAAAAAHLVRVGWNVRVVDLSSVVDKQSLLEAFRAGLTLPGWVGRNWDALADALGDLSWWEPGARGRALIVAGAGRMEAGLDREWAILCDVLQEACARWAPTPMPLGVVVRGRALA